MTDNKKIIAIIAARLDRACAACWEAADYAKEDPTDADAKAEARRLRAIADEIRATLDAARTSDANGLWIAA